MKGRETPPMQLLQSCRHQPHCLLWAVKARILRREDDAASQIRLQAQTGVAIRLSMRGRERLGQRHGPIT
eukprot:4185709-Lingulodinium_polyedra.AAC.1